MSEAETRVETVIAAAQAGERLDRALAAHLEELSRSRLKALILAGHVTISGRTIRDPSHHVNAGDEIAVVVPPAEPAEPGPEPIPLAVVYEDDDVIVIDKPRGLVVHPAAGNWTGTLVNALVAHCGASLSGVGGVRRPGIVHRLDKDTTGLMVVAKNDRAHRSLAAQFADHGRTGPLERGYLAFVWSAPDRPKGVIDKPIDRHPQARERMAVRAEGRPAVTHWQVLERYPPAGAPVASLLACRLETGRTHQIRVHLAAIGHPLLGDDVYGPGFKTKAVLLPQAGPGGAGGPFKTGPPCLYAGLRTPGERGALGVSIRAAARPRKASPCAGGIANMSPPVAPRRNIVSEILIHLNQWVDVFGRRLVTRLVTAN